MTARLAPALSLRWVPCRTASRATSSTEPHRPRAGSMPAAVIRATPFWALNLPASSAFTAQQPGLTAAGQHVDRGLDPRDLGWFDVSIRRDADQGAVPRPAKGGKGGGCVRRDG